MDRVILPGTNLQECQPAGFQLPPQHLPKRTIGGQAVLPAVQSRPRLIAPDLRLKGSDIRRSYIGRIAENYIVLAGYLREILSEPEGAVSEPMFLDIAMRPGQCLVCAVHADAPRVRVFMQGRNEKTARTRPQIEDVQRRRTVRKTREHLLDQRLGFRPGDKRAGTDREIEAPEFLAAGDVGDGLACNAASDEGFEFGVIGRGLAQHPRVEPGIVHARGAQLLDRVLQLPASSSARRSAWSAVTSASTISPRSSPEMMRSSL